MPARGERFVKKERVEIKPGQLWMRRKGKVMVRILELSRDGKSALIRTAHNNRISSTKLGTLHASYSYVQGSR